MLPKELAVELLPDSEHDQWDQDVTQLPDATVFHTNAWLDSLAEVMRPSLWGGTRVVRLRVLRGRDPVGLWPGIMLNMGPARAFGSPFPGWQTRDLGPLCSDCDPEEAVRALLRFCWRGRIVHLEMADRKLPSEAMHALGFQPVNFSTWVLDLRRSEDDLWAGLKGRARTAVRYAKKHGVEVRTRTDDGFVEDYWRLTESTFSRLGMTPPLTRARLASLVAHLQPVERVRLMSAHYEGQAIAAGIFPHDRHAVYYWGGATDPAHNRLSASNLIQWELITWAVGQGLHRYDMYGAGVERIDKFKSSFGPKLVRYHHWIRSRLPRVQSLRRLGRVLKRRREGVAEKTTPARSDR